MNNKKQRNKKRSVYASDFSALSTLGEALTQQSPEIVKKMGEIRYSDQVVERLVKILHDLFPLKWNGSLIASLLISLNYLSAIFFRAKRFLFIDLI